MNQVLFDSICQKQLLTKLAREHSVSAELNAKISRGTLRRVVAALSLASILLTGAVLANLLSSMLSAIALHVFR